jgi:hypothetical protein
MEAGASLTLEYAQEAVMDFYVLSAYRRVASKWTTQALDSTQPLDG